MPARDAIAGSAIAGDSDDEEWALARRGVFIRRRITAYRNRYPNVNTGPVEAFVPTPATPVYDGLSADKRSAVDALVVAARMTQPKGDT